jgi:hypothetical protein
LSSCSNLFEKTLTYTGSGGGNNQIDGSFSRFVCGYGYTIWLDDWKKIKSHYQARMVEHNLTNYPKPFIDSHSVNWRVEKLRLKKFLEKFS